MRIYSFAHINYKKPPELNMHFKLETALKAELQNFGIYTENKKARWTDYPPGFKNRGKRTRTLDIWFWRPTFYRLNYTPIKAPRVGLEPTTHRLTADCSTTELSRNINNMLLRKRRRWDLNPCAAINDLSAFQANPFNHLGTSPKGLTNNKHTI